MNTITQIRHHMNHFFIPRKINVALTKRVIALHDQGYVFDFSVTTDHDILCVQDGRLFTVDQTTIIVVDMLFDQITYAYKYIHVVETCCGDKGLLVDRCLCVNELLAVKARINPLSDRPAIGASAVLLT
ncbi:MAG: hypothetical protein M3O71_06525 [Bacteroidota bacterium]|nr:hypothetical protein [Bacteroidota bacterium]